MAACPQPLAMAFLKALRPAFSGQTRKTRAPLRRSAFLSILWVFLDSPSALAESCGHAGGGERVQVTHVWDGDTLILTARRKLRVIGIDTPELGGPDRDQEGRSPQPLAVEARDRLRKLLGREGYAVSLRYDKQREDRYGRLLAHVYTVTDINIGAWLLEQGLGTTLTVPPNLWNLTCYQAAEQRARRARLGIWKLAEYQLHDAANLDDKARGFHRLRGQVKRVGESQKSLWIALKGPVSLRIDRDDLPNFPGLEPDELVGRPIIVRGWLHPYRGELSMRIRHPYALQPVRSGHDHWIP